jgi:hypothetical protein
MGIEGRNVPFFAVYTMPNLGAGSGDRAALQQAISETLAERKVTAPLRLIVIDTMRRSMPGKSENEQKDVSIVLDNCEALPRISAAWCCWCIIRRDRPATAARARMLLTPRPM